MRIKSLLALCFPLFLLGDALALDAGGKHFVWKIEGQTNTVYLLGSVHFLRAEDYPLPDAFESAYLDAEELYMELDLDDLDPVHVVQITQEKGLLKDGQSLRELMGGDYAKAASHAEEIGLDLGMLTSAKPWLAALTVVQLQLTKLGYDQQHGVEMHFVRKAQDDSKEIHGFETMQYQLELLDDLPPSSQRDFLLQTLAEAADMEEEMESIMVAWRAGDSDSVAQQMLEELKKLPGLYRTLITDRNESWLKTVLDLLRADKDYLIVVGAGHLAGKDSLVNKLERLGYSAEQL